MVEIIAFAIVGLVLGLIAAKYADYVLVSELEGERHKLFCMRNVITSIITAIVYSLIIATNGINVYSMVLLLTTIALISLSIVDWCSYEIPIQYNYYLFGLGVVATAFDYKHWYSHIIGMLLVSGIFYLILVATHGRGMGGGDVKLMFTVGLIIGWQEILLVMLIGSVLGAVIHSVIARVKNGDHMLAFGPYLSAASIIAMVWGTPLINMYISYLKTGMK